MVATERVFSATLLAAAVVAALGLVGAGAYLGSSWMILAGMVGIPVLLVAMVAAHFLRLRPPPTSTPFHEMTHRWSRRLAGAVAAGERAGVAPAVIDGLLQEVGEALAPHATVERDADQGVRVVAAKGEPPRGGWVHRKERALTTALREAGRKAKPDLERQVGLLLQRTASGDPGEVPERLPEGDLTEVCEAYTRQVEQRRGALRDQVRSMEKAVHDVEGQGLDVSEAWQHVRAAKDHAEAGRIEFAVQALDDANRSISHHVEPELKQRHRELAEALHQVTSLDVRGLVEPRTLEAIHRLQDEFEHLELDAKGLTALDDCERRFAECIQGLTREVIAKSREVRDALASMPQVVDREDVIDVVKSLEALPLVTHPWRGTFDEWLTDASVHLPRARRYHGYTFLLQHFDRLEDTIRKKLAEDGEVGPEDLRLRERAPEVLELFQRAHSDEAELVGNRLRRKLERDALG